ncbi:unnamed protein product [Mytilus coruscus]|uniref:Death domain-containing protein n=1 Tax=Mytilus coruscus TaxID=42192 RepID=A0A6J8D505_MYTCO|nr:unnamed protein product [Mytilus coruscus]
MSVLWKPGKALFSLQIAKEECEVDCQGLQEDALNQIPSDIELQRFSSRCEETVIRELAIHLGITLNEWETLRSKHEFVDIVKYRVLVTWREKYSGRFSNIAKALQDMSLSTHTLCQVKRIRKGHSDISEEYMDLIPTDEILDKLAQVIGVVSFQLGLELGLPITSIDIIQYNNGRDLVAQCKEILYQWREDQRIRPTIGVLVQALVNVDRGAKCLEEIIKTVGVKKYIPFYRKKKKIKTFLKKLNPFQKKIPIDSIKTGSESLLHRFKRMEPDDFKMFIAKGEYESYENRVYLAGACNVGKSCLASILIGEEIQKKWISTNGLTIYFGRNGINLEDKKMVTLVKSDTNIMKKLLLGNPNIVEKPVLSEPRNVNEEATDHEDSALKLSELNTVDKEFKYSDQKQENKSPSKTKDENPNVPSLTENVKTNLPSYPQMYPKHKVFTIQSDILKEIRTGEYKIKIAPSDLVDFGGQRCFDMTHQLFIQHKGTFVLMFDGRYELHTPLEEYPQGETGKDILVHWVNSILLYCKEDDDLLPLILFAATHSDCLEKDAMLAKERIFTQELAKLFSTHVKNGHILYDRVFFINATNSKDPQIEHLKEKLVDIAFQQSTWGQKMPISWVPLELQISEMRTNNFSVIEKETIQELNRLNDEFSLPEYLIDKFLRIQHSLGKILYFNIQGLDNFIVVQPTVMVNILRSFITDSMFWPEQQDLRSILENTANTGTIKKLQLFQLWSQPPFDVYLPTDQHKEYIINVLAHLDILVQPKHESKVKTSDPLYMVPSVVKTKLPDNLCPCKEQETICLSYYLKDCAIPSALTFKLIAAAVIIWPLKEIDGRPCLFFQSAILNIDDKNQLLIAIKGQRVIVYLINKESRYLISPDVAASIQECMTSALQRVLHFYHECFGQTPLKTDEVSLLEKEVGFICNQEPCLVSIEFAKSKKSWVCKNNQIEHHTKHCLYWIFKKQTNTCSKECKGLDVGTLSLRPNDQHLVRIAKQIPITIFDQFIIHLGLTREKWEEIEYQFLAKEGALGSKLMAMYELQNIKEIEDQPVIFKDLSDALKKMDRPHSLCQILREDTKLIDNASSTLQEIPSDEILKKLPNKLGNCTIQLGLELGLSFSRIQKTMSNNSKDMYKQLYDILNEWKISSKSRPSVLNLMKALQQTQSGGLKFLREQYKHN